MAFVTVIEAGVGDEFTVWGNIRRLVGTVAMGELCEGTVNNADFEEFGVEGFVFVVCGAIHGKDKRLSIGSPGGIGATKIADARTMGEIAGSQLTRCTAVCGYDENLRIAGFQVSRAVEAVDEIFINLGCVGPLGALGCSGERGDFWKSGGDERGESEQPSVRRPGNAG